MNQPKQVPLVKSGVPFCDTNCPLRREEHICGEDYPYCGFNDTRIHPHQICLPAVLEMHKTGTANQQKLDAVLTVMGDMQYCLNQRIDLKDTESLLIVRSWLREFQDAMGDATPTD